MSNDLSLEILNSSFTEASLALLGINFRLSAITSDPEYLAQPKNLPITTGEPDIPSASITNVPSATDVFQIKVHHFPRCCNRIWPGRTIRRKCFREIFADRRIGSEKSRNLRNCKNTFVSNIHCGEVQFYKMRYVRNWYHFLSILLIFTDQKIWKLQKNIYVYMYLHIKCTQWYEI